MNLLERAHQIITNWDQFSDEPYDGGIHPNDYRASIKEWLEDYARAEELAKTHHMMPENHNYGEGTHISTLGDLMRMRILLQPYADKSFSPKPPLTLDLSHHKKAIEDRSKS